MVDEAIANSIKLYTKPFSSILLFGPPGSGKDFLGNFIAQGGTQVYVSLGDIFRCYPIWSPIRQLFHKYAVSGALIPDDDVVAVWNYYVQGLISVGKFLPDRQDLLISGLPRTLGQAKLLESYITVRHVIILEVHEESTLLERTQHSLYSKGRINEVGIDVLQKRLESYKKDIDALIRYYPLHKVSRISADQKPMEVLRDVLSRLAHVFSHPGRPVD
ncbi:Adenylate kinase [Chlamydia avium]|uniref:Adenylate kinase n=1 Tax=Chlamydia avium 10DC88 TaxID=1229831 RepID=W8JR95_9CHLA|nr:nucleoside monophosphate kinase [Chlamydia avium]AHK63383.1 Adenylate kinase [Chlamydia avium 10DC88]VVT42983.1 Adenylate kinase [Chlamydia avium]